MIKKASTLLAACFVAFNMSAQNDQKTEGYEFTPVKENKITSIKNQNRSSTCWSFSGQAFLESELIRMGKGEHDLSDMFVVHHSWQDKADKYVRMHGEINFGAGGAFDDVFYTLKHYGAVPEEAMRGLNYGDTMHVHNELDAIARGYVDAVRKIKKLT
ncbi:MAG: C1 family peptidase, partial [Bacteroidales bacterium]